jgi:hypothetical protein
MNFLFSPRADILVKSTNILIIFSRTAWFVTPGFTGLPKGNKYWLLPRGAAQEANRACRDEPRGLELVKEAESRGRGSRESNLDTPR